MRLPSLAILLSFITYARGAVVALGPGPNEVYKTGGSCVITYSPDTAGLWRNTTIDLWTGSDTDFIWLTTVVTGLDGTTGTSPATYKWKCPEVTLNAPVYFYSLSDLAVDPTGSSYTTRFTIAAADGTTTTAPNVTTADGVEIHWGIGQLVASTSATGSAASNDTTPTPASMKTFYSTALVTSYANGSPTTPLATETPTATTSASADSSTTTCGWDSLCPESSPCCSEYGVCGSGVSCLAGCDPIGSFNASACMPIPAFKDTNYFFNDDTKGRLLPFGEDWDGDADNYDFTFDLMGDLTNDPVYQNNLELALTEDNGGTRISSTRSLLFGNVTARIKGVASAGVVTAFILMSGVKDEIDWEFTTANDSIGLTNYFWMGDVANYTAGGTSPVPGRSTTFHDFGFVWTPDSLCWMVDGVMVRTLQKSDTEDPLVPGLFHFPQTPSRIQLSIWPGGLESNSQGTIDWSGGLIDWTSPLYTPTSSFITYVESINVTCYQDPTLSFFSTEDAASSTDPTTGADTSPTTAVIPSATFWWSPDSLSSPSSSGVYQRRRLELTPRADVVATPNITSYVYTGNDTVGQPAVSGSDAPTLITSEYACSLQSFLERIQGECRQFRMRLSQEGAFLLRVVLRHRTILPVRQQQPLESRLRQQTRLAQVVRQRQEILWRTNGTPLVLESMLQYIVRVESSPSCWS